MPNQKVPKVFQEMEGNTMIALLSIMQSQRQDIRQIFERLDTSEEQSSRLEAKLDEQTHLLAQILERLPEKQ